MKIDPHRRGCQAGAIGDLRSRHPLHETHEQRFAVRLGQRPNHGQGSARILAVSLRLGGGHLVLALNETRRSSHRAARDIPRNARQPPAEGFRVPQVSYLLQCAEKDFLDDVVHVVDGDMRQRDRMHRADVTDIEIAECAAVARLCGADQSHLAEACV